MSMRRPDVEAAVLLSLGYEGTPAIHLSVYDLTNFCEARGARATLPDVRNAMEALKDAGLIYRTYSGGWLLTAAGHDAYVNSCAQEGGLVYLAQLVLTFDPELLAVEVGQRLSIYPMRDREVETYDETSFTVWVSKDGAEPAYIAGVPFVTDEFIALLEIVRYWQRCELAR